jgi:PAS domain S-box-containing protein
MAPGIARGARTGLNAPSASGETARLYEHGSDIFRLLVEGARDYAIFMLDTQGMVVSWNAGAERIKGYRADEIIGRHFCVFYPTEAVQSQWPQEELRRAIEFGRFEDEGWRVRKDGTCFWANVVITALRAPDGTLLGFSKITRDLTERREHEERLRRSEENLRLLVEGVRDHAIIMLGAQGEVMSWNAGAQRLLGYEAEEIIGRPASAFYTEEDATAHKPQTELAIARHAGVSTDTGWRLRRDGSRMWADVTLTALHERDGSVRGFVQIMRDLTQRRRVQELESEGQRINEFIAMLAHELRNPLAPIGNAVGIMEKMVGTPELVWCTKLIGRQVLHLSRLVDDLLDVSRITSGKIQLRRETLDLKALVEAAVETVRPTVTSFGHELLMELPHVPVYVEGDATRLTQVVVNLLTNAAKYTPNGGCVQVRLQERSGMAVIYVIDNGIGMSKALMENAFDMFVQGERTLDRAEGGLGIGLTLVKRIVKMHGGTVSATSAGAGQGSEFTVRIPLVDAPVQAAASPPARAAHPARARKILVVDDNEDAAQSLATLLRLSGHEAEVANDGPQALRLAGASPPDAVLLDLGLPGMDGLEVARRLREIPTLAHTRLVAMTGYAQEVHRQAAREAGFTTHLVKPVDFEDLMNAIQAPAP